jgi:hypothetical protein
MEATTAKAVEPVIYGRKGEVWQTAEELKRELAVLTALLQHYGPLPGNFVSRTGGAGSALLGPDDCAPLVGGEPQLLQSPYEWASERTIVIRRVLAELGEPV